MINLFKKKFKLRNILRIMYILILIQFHAFSSSNCEFFENEKKSFSRNEQLMSNKKNEISKYEKNVNLLIIPNLNEEVEYHHVMRILEVQERQEQSMNEYLTLKMNYISQHFNKELNNVFLQQDLSEESPNSETLIDSNYNKNCCNIL